MPFALYVNGFVVLHDLSSVDVCKVNPVIVVETVTFTFPLVQLDIYTKHIKLLPVVGVGIDVVFAVATADVIVFPALSVTLVCT